MEKDIINHPSHYTVYSVEVIDMMIRIFGIEAVISYCECAAFKYRMRAGLKEGNTVEQDYAKEQWYLKKARELRNG